MAEFPYRHPRAASATGGKSGCPRRGSNTGASHGAGADLMAQKLRLRQRMADDDKMCAGRRASWQLCEGFDKEMYGTDLLASDGRSGCGLVDGRISQVSRSGLHAGKERADCRAWIV